MSVKAVIFDFGGVLVRTRSQHLRAAWEARLGLAPGAASAIVFNSESGRAAQLGHITDAMHWRWVGEVLGLQGEELARFRHDFFAEDVLDQELLAYIDRLAAAGLRTGLLSNAADNARSVFANKYRILSHFHSVTISAEEGVMKPDPRIFHIALTRAGTLPAETIFVDDFPENVAAAQALGMIGLHFRDPLAARQELQRITGVS
ncbi:MAG: HAD family phosphatase [Anaerolineae bacterium]|nr:HAD family phosphatase [Anaerolineae bacterium]